jgi:putative ABC transport system substrate-binding protein
MCHAHEVFEITLLGGAVAVWQLAAHAQQPAKVYRVGTLSSGAAVADQSPNGVSLVRGFARLGYTQDGKLLFERRGAEGHIDRLPRLVDELVAAKVDEPSLPARPYFP